LTSKVESSKATFVALNIKGTTVVMSVTAMHFCKVVNYEKEKTKAITNVGVIG